MTGMHDMWVPINHNSWSAAWAIMILREALDKSYGSMMGIETFRSWANEMHSLTFTETQKHTDNYTDTLCNSQLNILSNK